MQGPALVVLCPYEVGISHQLLQALRQDSTCIDLSDVVLIRHFVIEIADPCPGQLPFAFYFTDEDSTRAALARLSEGCDHTATGVLYTLYLAFLVDGFEVIPPPAVHEGRRSFTSLDPCTLIGALS